jgi:hypothetical protein
MESSSTTTTNILRARHKDSGRETNEPPGIAQQDEVQDDQEYVVAVITWLVVGLLIFVVLVGMLHGIGVKVKPSTL